MATRPIFLTASAPPYVVEKNVEFEYYSGFSKMRKQQSWLSLHAAFLRDNPGTRVLEISTKSTERLGVLLSAFNLMICTHSGGLFSVEAAFQGSKVFKYGGPYTDLLTKTAREAKEDPRLKESGELQEFCFENQRFELSPSTLFYNWVYVNALDQHPQLGMQLIDYDAFTDIEFNPKKSLNCQARAAAVYVSLRKNGSLERALEDKAAFLEEVYGGAQVPCDQPVQGEHYHPRGRQKGARSREQPDLFSSSEDFKK